ncbi:hypothetical protein SSX86_024387 [Deinandra increscens subsp. villosa]|uniref:J domain-containing protein n=1 Tax=Deinandra increscens subsp. villosa TaxID=3103831 RepID=A0AAP0CJ62_9ASTR
MAFSTSPSFFTSPNFTVNQRPSSSPSSSVRYGHGKAKSTPISANFATATAERTTSRSPRIATTSSLYEVLGIQIGADTVEIKAAYRRLARVLHPDVGNHDSSPDDFIKVNSAYATLSDPGKRADYDRSLFVRQKSTVIRTPSPVGYGGYGGRRWETDQCCSVRYGHGKAKSPPISANFATATAERTTSRSPRIATTSSLYDVLGIQIGADTVEIKAAYRKLARVLHPDVGNHDSSADEFMKVHSAYATLSDPGKRADYDRSLFVRQKMGARTSSPAGYSGRRWETDQCW